MEVGAMRNLRGSGIVLACLVAPALAAARPAGQVAGADVLKADCKRAQAKVAREANAARREQLPHQLMWTNAYIAGLAGLGRPAVEPLTALVKGDDPALRAWAAEALKRMGDDAASTVPDPVRAFAAAVDATARAPTAGRGSRGSRK
jgi:hypothetical protein